MKRKYMIGSKFYLYTTDSEIPTIARLVSYEEGDKVKVNYGGYTTIVYRCELDSELEKGFITKVDEDIYRRTIEGCVKDQKWFRLMGEKEDLFIKFKVCDSTAVISIDDLDNRFVLLNPDGFITISNIIYDKGKSKDVAVTVHKGNELAPSIVARQNVLDIFYQPRDYHRKVGMAVSRETYGNAFDTLYDAEEAIDFKSIAAYKEDDLDTILRYIGSTRKYNNTLKRIAAINTAKIYRDMYIGLCRTVKELLDNNEFMLEFNGLFDILEYPYLFDLSRVNAIGHEYDWFQEIFHDRKIVDLRYFPYDRTMDLKDILERDEKYFFVKAIDGSIFLILYYDARDVYG